MSDLPELTSPEVQRYARHLTLEQIGVKGQQQLKASRVLCVGTGGLGSPLLMYLAAAGVGRIGLVDFDVVDESNLQRQIIHGTASVGRSKVQSAVDRIADLNPHIQVDVWEEAITSANALEMIKPYDVVVDGTDNFPTRYLINDACEMLGKPNVYGSVFGFEGQASVFNYQEGPTYRDLYPAPPPPGLVPNCEEGGILGVLPGVIGLVQATEVLKILLGLGTTLSGRLLLYDALSMRFREIRLQKRAGATPVTELIDYQQFCGAAPTSVRPVAEDFERISALEADRRLQAGWKPYVLDVRKAHESEIVSLAFTDKLHSVEMIREFAAEVPPDQDILVYCRSGVRSAKACAVLAGMGFERLLNLEGGINAWAKDVDPRLPTY